MANKKEKNSSTPNFWTYFFSQRNLHLGLFHHIFVYKTTFCKKYFSHFRFFEKFEPKQCTQKKTRVQFHPCFWDLKKKSFIWTKFDRNIGIFLSAYKCFFYQCEVCKYLTFYLMEKIVKNPKFPDFTRLGNITYERTPTPCPERWVSTILFAMYT